MGRDAVEVKVGVGVGINNTVRGEVTILQHRGRGPRWCELTLLRLFTFPPRLLAWLKLLYSLAGDIAWLSTACGGCSMSLSLCFMRHLRCWASIVAFSASVACVRKMGDRAL